MQEKFNGAKSPNRENKGNSSSTGNSNSSSGSNPSNKVLSTSLPVPVPNAVLSDMLRRHLLMESRDDIGMSVDTSSSSSSLPGALKPTASREVSAQQLHYETATRDDELRDDAKALTDLLAFFDQMSSSI